MKRKYFLLKGKKNQQMEKKRPTGVNCLFMVTQLVILVIANIKNLLCLKHTVPCTLPVLSLHNHMREILLFLHFF